MKRRRASLFIHAHDARDVALVSEPIVGIGYDGIPAASTICANRSAIIDGSASPRSGRPKLRTIEPPLA